jgi:hypothetical protein
MQQLTVATAAVLKQSTIDGTANVLAPLTNAIAVNAKQHA